MNKILVPVAVVIAAYLIYGQMSSNDLESDIVKADDSPAITEAVTKVEEPIHFVPDVIVPDIDTDPLIGSYYANIENENIIAKVTVEILPDNKISHTRYINRKGDISEATVNGTYSINGNRLTFDFPEERNKDVFKMGQLILDVEEGGQLVSGTVAFNKN